MAYVYDYFKGDLLHEHPIKQVSSDPASAKEGSLIINTTTDAMKVYYGGTWQTLHTLTPGVATGIGTWIIETDFVVS